MIIYYFRKRKNFNRIKKLIQTNPVHIERTFDYRTQRNINLYCVQDIIIRFSCIQYHHRNVAEKYEVFERFEIKQIDLDENQIKILLELSEAKY